ncbi:Protein CBG23317 [Caenorhabditis briggsae]|uniref:Protein CBG23317 n=1 Tax=Caenorhabditis briggsae TaxID=6238 RepID=A8Y476_CAEBR|nr:Protein CBG23317 [Caenorhabditis briggsae]CAP39696.1 Protein CBG23317 [Caenorhabditis briggsae]
MTSNASAVGSLVEVSAFNDELSLLAATLILTTRNNGSIMDKEARIKMKRNIILFFQTMLQDSLYLIDLTFTFKLNGLSTHRFWTFISGTLVWECIHSVDGYFFQPNHGRRVQLHQSFEFSCCYANHYEDILHTHQLSNPGSSISPTPCILEMSIKLYKGCHALYSTKNLAWSYDDSEQCDFVDDALDIIFYTFIAMSILNTITFVKILHFYRKRNANQDKETKKRMRKNTIHFLQTMLQDSLYLIDLTFTFRLSSWSDHRVWRYVSGTLIWELLHSTDGFVMVMFNERLSFIKKTIQNSSTIPVIAGPKNLRQGTISASTIPSTK